MGELKRRHGVSDSGYSEGLMYSLRHSISSALMTLAVNEYGFEPSKEYLSKCHLCFEIRRFLALEKGVESRELQPRGFYESS